MLSQKSLILSLFTGLTQTKRRDFRKSRVDFLYSHLFRQIPFL